MLSSIFPYNLYSKIYINIHLFGFSFLISFRWLLDLLKNRKNMTFIHAIYVAVMLLLSRVHARHCNPSKDISECYPALITQGVPSSHCCYELDHHMQCFSKYIDPNYSLHPPNYPYLQNISEICDIYFPISPS